MRLTLTSCLCRIVEGEYVDPEFENGVQRIFDLVWKTKEKDLVERYGLWLIPHDRALGLKVRDASHRLSNRSLTALLSQLFNDPKQTITFETRELFTKISAVDSAAADSYLEGAVLQERDSVRWFASEQGAFRADWHLHRTHDCMSNLLSGTSIG